jgi:hypothetical protein
MANRSAALIIQAKYKLKYTEDIIISPQGSVEIAYDFIFPNFRITE